MKIISNSLLEYYKKNQPISIIKHFNKLSKTDKNSLDFYNTISAVYSSLIEGSFLLVSDYIKIQSSGMNKTNKDYKQVNILIAAYKMAQSNQISEKSFLAIHKKATKTLISQIKYQGLYRDAQVGVFDQFGQKIYTGCDFKIVQTEMKNLFADIKILVKQKLTYSEVFYFASMIHLVFVKIHPFADGNGRAGRLLEKWFLATMLGADAWKIQNEKLYHKRLKSYYKNLNIGITYDKVNYDLSFGFLKMLPMALRIK